LRKTLSYTISENADAVVFWKLLLLYVSAIICTGKLCISISSVSQVSIFLLEKFMVTKPVKKLPSIYARFINMFTQAYNWTLSWARWIQSTCSHLHFNIILPSKSPSFSFSNYNSVCILHSSYACYIPRPSHSPW